MKKLYKYVPYLSPDLIYQKIHPLQNAAFDADCLTSLINWKFHDCKKWILVMLSRIVTPCKNFQILICSLLSKKRPNDLILKITPENSL